MIICFTHGPANTFKGAKSKRLIELQQTGFDKFTVVYGLQVKTDLDYSDACTELGSCIMHYQSCEGTIDNRYAIEARKDGDKKPVATNYQTKE
jgi:hypothetical protein